MPHSERRSGRGAARGVERSARRPLGRAASPAARGSAASLSEDTAPPEQSQSGISNAPVRATHIEINSPFAASTLAARSVSGRDLEFLARMTQLTIAPSPSPPPPFGQSHSSIEASATMQPSEENDPRSPCPGTRQRQRGTRPEQRRTTAARSAATLSASISSSSLPVSTPQAETAAAAHSTEATDLIDTMANNQATQEQNQLFGSRVQSDTGFLRQVIERDSMYRSRRTAQDYHRAMSLRIAVRDYAGTAMAFGMFPQDDELVRVVVEINRVIELGQIQDQLGLNRVSVGDGFTPEQREMFPALSNLRGVRLGPDERPVWDPISPQTGDEARQGGARASSAPTAAAAAAAPRSSAASPNVEGLSSSSLRPESGRVRRPSTSPARPEGSRIPGSPLSFSPRSQGGGRAGSPSPSSPRPRGGPAESPASSSSPRPERSSRATAGRPSSSNTSPSRREGGGGGQAGPSRSGSDELWKGIFKQK